MNKSFYLSILLLTLLAIPLVASAHCKGKHTGSHPHCVVEPPPPPTGCTDQFPGFIYRVEGTRRTSPEMRLSSVDGCRTEFLWSDQLSNLMHVTDDWSKGVVVAVENHPDNSAQHTVKLRHFTVDVDGNPTQGETVTLLPEAIPPEDSLRYWNQDVWGDATHASLYMAIVRNHRYGENPEVVIQELLIYNLNDMSDSRVVSRIEGSEWDTNCPDVEYPQFVPSCYDAIHGVNLNQSGTRVYLLTRPNTITDERWDAVLRIDIDRFDLNGDELQLADWSFSAPELVYTGTEGFRGMSPRPSADRYELPFPEQIGARSSTLDAILDADLCAVMYEEYADGANDANDAGPDLWETWCIVPENGGAGTWLTPNTQLFTSRTNRGDNIRRRQVDGSGDELLIEKAQHPNAGY